MNPHKYLDHLLAQSEPIAENKAQKDPTPENSALLFAVRLMSQNRATVSHSDNLHELHDKLDRNDALGALTAAFEGRKFSQATTRHAMGLLENVDPAHRKHILGITDGFLDPAGVDDYIAPAAVGWLGLDLADYERTENGVLLLPLQRKNNGEGSKIRLRENLG